MATMSHR